MRSAYYRGGDGVLHERFGLPLEALEAGQVFLHRPAITFSQQENVDEALSTLNAASIHYDEDLASRSTWHRPLMVSTWTLQRMIGMTWKTFGAARRRMEVMHEVRMHKPVFAGDTLGARTHVLAVGHDARARLRTELRNQHGDTVASADYTVLMWRASEGPWAVRREEHPVDEPRFASHVAQEGAWVETYGLCFEDLRAGESFSHALRRALDAQELAAITRRAMEWSPAGRAQEPAHDLAPGDLAAPQAWLLGLATALTTLTLGRVSANLGWTDVRFLRDAHPGDLLQAHSTIRALRPSATRPAEGITQVHTTLLNARAEAVVDFQRTLLVYRRGCGPALQNAHAPAHHPPTPSPANAHTTKEAPCAP